jgi:hypothetical protein
MLQVVGEGGYHHEKPLFLSEHAAKEGAASVGLIDELN